jgi:hypothetical protein
MNNEPVYGTYIGGDDKEEAGTARFRTAKIQTGDGVQSVPFMHTPQGIRSAYGESPAVVMNPRRGGGYEMLSDNRKPKIQKHRGYHNGRPDDPHGVTSYNEGFGGTGNDWGPPGGSRVPVRPRGPVGSGGATVSMKG